MFNFTTYINEHNEKYTHNKLELPDNITKLFNKQKNGLFTNATLSHDGIQIEKNEWLLMERISSGKGAFGTVMQAKMKVVIKDKTAYIEPANSIVKHQSLKNLSDSNKETRIKEIDMEAKYQKLHRVPVKGYYIDSKKENTYLIMENCGTSLDKILHNCSYSFDERILIAHGILNEMLLLEQNGLIHRDLKPANICIKKIGQQFQVRFIDFGLANNKAQENLSGTSIYMSPAATTSHATDRYALSAILGEVFGCPPRSLFKDKIPKKSNITLLTQANYNFEDIFQDVMLPAYIDKALITDFKCLLLKLQKGEISVNIALKFLLCLPIRTNFYNSFILLQNEITKIDLDNQSPIYQKLVNVIYAKPTSHLNLSQELCNNNKKNSDYINPYFNDGKYNLFIKDTNVNLNNLLLSENYFLNTNSTGISTLFTILKSETSPLKKLDEIHKLGKIKTADSLSNWFSRSSFFGNGRHKNIDSLYTLLANINVDDINGSFKDIDGFITTKTLAHS